VPTAWTDAAEPDAFLVVSAGRSALRAEDLFALAELIETLGPTGRGKEGVRRIWPRV